MAFHKNYSFYFHVAMTLLLMFCFGLLPPFGSITVMGMKMLGIFLGLVYAWTFTSIIWPSLLAFVAITLTGAYSMNQFLAISIGNSTVCFMLFSMIFAAALQQIGLVDYFANWFCSRRILLGRPWLFTWVLLFGNFIAAALVNGAASTIIFLGIFFSIAKKCEFEKYAKYTTLMVFAIIFSGMTLGASALPHHLAGLLKISTTEAAIGYTVTFTEFSLFAFPSALLIMTLFVFFMRFALRPDVTPLLKMETNAMDRDGLKLNKKMKVGLFYLVVFIILLFLPDQVDKTSWLGVKLNAYGATGAVLLVLAAMLLTRFEGKAMYQFKKAADDGIIWDIIILFAVVLPFSSLMVSDATGIKETTVTYLKPLLVGHSPIVFMLIALAVQTLLTNVMNNAVLGVIFTNIMGPIAIALGMNPLPVLMAAMFTNQLAYLTPAASTSAALMFGYSDWVRAKDVYKFMPLIILFLFVAVFCMVLPWGYLILGGFQM